MMKQKITVIGTEGEKEIELELELELDGVNPIELDFKDTGEIKKIIVHKCGENPAKGIIFLEKSLDHRYQTKERLLYSGEPNAVEFEEV